mgnify:CR=1 FL=1
MLIKIILYCIISMAIMLLTTLIGDLINDTNKICEVDILKVLIFSPIFAPIILVILICLLLGLIVTVIETLFKYIKERMIKNGN